MRYLLVAILTAAMLALPAQAAMRFPPLTGRVVDEAHILPDAAKVQLTQELELFEQQTRHQLVVVTLKSLQGAEIEEYGVALGRKWGIGRKGKDDGVLLIVAPNERRVRIEVGYGLEGKLTDALSSQIIQDVIIPEFKHGDMTTGTMNGARAIIGVLGDKAYTIPQPAEVKKSPLGIFLFWVFLALFIYIFYRLVRYGGFSSSGGGGGRSNDDSSGGGFSGGGGSFGGGGSSGSW